MLSKTHENYFIKKIYLISEIIDLHITGDISEIYDSMWSNSYIKALKDCYEKVNFINFIALGDVHSIAACSSGKILSWGWNDNG